jgi:MYXO-CTERM domain-containing protein
MRRAPLALLASLAVASFPQIARAGDVNADPTSYQAALASLKPGDTLHLAAGTYPLLVIQSLAGTAASPITIAGPEGGGAVIEGDSGHNTVEIVESSYVTIRGLTIDSKGLDGIFGISAKDGANNHVHHITVEGCTLKGQNASQQTVGISTKTPTWGWVIRGNVIDGAGTGMYLGNSDGTQPFVAGIIEWNLIENTIGYNAQIKWQAPWPSGAGLPAGPNRTIIRNNVFIKNDQPSPDGDRPNLLIGGAPESGDGSQDLYEIYGNFFFHNPREALLQVAGRVTIHDNVFVDASAAAIVAQDHDLPLRMARIYNNTIYTQSTGIHFGSSASEGDFVVGNLIFAGTPLDGPIAQMASNLTAAFSAAGDYVAAPSFMLGAIDFYPRPGKATGAPMDLSAAAMDTEYDRDFNGTSKGTFTFRGAYAGEGQNPGWALGDGLKTSGGSSGTGGGGASTGQGGGGGARSGNGGTGGGGGMETSSGCGCRTAGGDASSAAGWAIVAAAAAFARRRKQR